MKRLLTVLIAAFLLAGFAIGRQRHHSASNPGSFDYYLLNLSWAPAFCAASSGHAPASECDPAHHFGFVVHGLWPQGENGGYPQDCGTASPVAQSIVQHMLPIMPSSSLIQHEWLKHGTCTGLSAQDYFNQIETGYKKVQIPAEYRIPGTTVKASPSQIEQKFAAANNAPAGTFRVVCSRTDLDVEACLTKDLQFRQCGSTLRDCNAGQVTFPPAP